MSAILITSTHGVALVRISDAGLKPAARRSLQIHISSELRHVSTIGKKLVKQQYLPHMSLQYGELGPLAAEIGPVVCGTPANFNWFRVLAALLHSAQPNCGVEQRVPPVFGRAAITLGIGPHF